MANLNIKKEDPQLWQLYMEVFEFHKKYGKVENTEDYWEALVRDSGELSKKYSLTPLHTLADHMLSAIVDYLDHICREQNGKNT